MRIIFLSALIGLLLGVLTGLLLFPSGASLKPDTQGLIHHPVYGTYPEKVPYQDGMTIMPGQTAEMQIEIEMPPAPETDRRTLL